MIIDKVEDKTLNLYKLEFETDPCVQFVRILFQLIVPRWKKLQYMVMTSGRGLLLVPESGLNMVSTVIMFNSEMFTQTQ